MSIVPLLNSAKCVLAALVITTGSGCDTAATRAQSAHDEYQTAIALNDLPRARTALVRLVTAKDDVADYWMELGRVEVQLGNFEEAYQAFSRAYELKQGDPVILQALLQIALKAGDLKAARKHAEEFELLSPNNPIVLLTYGIIELRRGNSAKAIALADRMLELSPLDANATFLKSQALLFSGKPQDAEQLLEDQLDARPQDPTALHGLSLLYRLRENWPALATILQRRRALEPANFEYSLEFIEAALLAGRTAEARAASHDMLKSARPPRQAKAILDLWARLWPGGQKVADARALAARASPENRIVYAAFLNRIGAPRDALAILPDASKIALRRDNLDLHAAHARSLALLGRTAEAKKTYDAILQLDGQHADALAGRADIAIRAGAGTAAVYDAQQLIASRPASAEARLLLARAYGTARDRRMKERALWTAFRELPANTEVYEELRRYVASTGGPEAARQVEKEYEAQRRAKFMRELI